MRAADYKGFRQKRVCSDASLSSLPPFLSLSLTRVSVAVRNAPWPRQPGIKVTVKLRFLRARVHDGWSKGMDGGRDS